MRVASMTMAALVLAGAGGTTWAQLRQPNLPTPPVASVNPQALFFAQAGNPVRTIVNDSIRTGYLDLGSGAVSSTQSATSDIQANGVGWMPINGARIAKSARTPQAPVTTGDCASLQYLAAAVTMSAGQSFCVITGTGHVREIYVTRIGSPPPQSTNHTATVIFDLTQWP